MSNARSTGGLALGILTIGVAMALAPRAGLVPGTAAAQGSSSIKIPFESYTLANGLTVITSIDRTTPTVAVNMWYHLRS